MLLGVSPEAVEVKVCRARRPLAEAIDPDAVESLLES